MISSWELQKLYVEDRYDHVVNEIKPAIDRGEVVLADRYWFSTLAYGMLSDPLEKLVGLHDEVFSANFLKPDLTFIFDLSAEAAIERLEKLGKSADHFENLAKLKKIRENYLTLAGAKLGEVVVIDAAEFPEVISRKICRTIEDMISR